MELPVLVLPHPPGFRATTGGPLDLVADGPTPDAAMDALKTLVTEKVRPGQLRKLTVTDIDTMLASAAKLGASPLFEDWVKAVEEYRREHNTIPDAD